MLTRFLSLAIAAAAATGHLRAQQECVLPSTPHDLGIDSSQSLPRALRTTVSIPLSQVAGTYRLRITAMHRADTVVGTLTLRRAPPVMRRFGEYQGTSNIDLSGVGTLSLAYSPNQADSLRPGVQFRYQA